MLFFETGAFFADFVQKVWSTTKKAFTLLQENGGHHAERILTNTFY
jgi:hypothetical protein